MNTKTTMRWTPVSYGIPWKWKSQENRLENDIASLEERLDEDNLSETEKNQILDELAVRKLQGEEMFIHKQKARLYDRKPVGTTRRDKIRNIS